MVIGFDAKRAYHNQTGLGHYSRTLIRSLATYFPENEYLLFNPKPSSLFSFNEIDLVKEILPSGFLNKTFSSAWRSNWVKKDIKKNKVTLYHGLSHEIPLNIHKTGVKSTVTIHDLIHERFPHQYSKTDRWIYSKKFRYACDYADKVIAISEQTKRDIIQYYNIDSSKITVCYQSCNEAFGKEVSAEKKQVIRQHYNLPEEYFLYVGSIIERKNLLGICKAYQIIRHRIKTPLVVIGSGGAYKEAVKAYIKTHQLEDLIIFLSDQTAAKNSTNFQNAVDFPAIYQQAKAMIYPSIFEGFGIPVLEALWSKIPVITSNISCLPEAGGDGAFYVDPYQPEEIASQLEKICSDSDLVQKNVEIGWKHAQKFSSFQTASAVMNLYRSLL